MAHRCILLVKRVVAEAGDVFGIEAGQVAVNHVPIQRDKGTRTMYESRDAAFDERRIYVETWPTGSATVVGAIEDITPRTIPRGHVFVLGDNRPASFDSRQFGPVPTSDFIGCVVSRHRLHGVSLPERAPVEPPT